MTDEEKVARTAAIIDWALTRPESEWRKDALPAQHGTARVALDNGYYGVNWVGVLPSEMELMEGAGMVKWMPVPDLNGGGMSWTFEKAKFKVGDRVRFPYGRKVGIIKAVGLQVADYDGRVIGLLYKVSTYELTEAQLKRFRAPRSKKSECQGCKYNEAGHFGNCDAIDGRRRRGK